MYGTAEGKPELKVLGYANEEDKILSQKEKDKRHKEAVSRNVGSMVKAMEFPPGEKLSSSEYSQVVAHACLNLECWELWELYEILQPYMMLTELHAVLQKMQKIGLIDESAGFWWWNELEYHG